MAEFTKAESQVTHSLNDSSGSPLQSGKRYLLQAPSRKASTVMISEDELNFDLWFREVGNPSAERRLGERCRS